MTVLMAITGVLAVICGFCCIFTPLITFLDAGYFIVILVAVYGVLGIVKAIREKRFGVGFVFSILSLIFGIAALFFPKLMLLTDGMMIYFTAAWFVLQGIVSIVTAVQVSKVSESKWWILLLIFGIIAILLGIYSFFHPMVTAVSIGFLIGFYFIETGFTMMFAAPHAEP